MAVSTQFLSRRPTIRELCEHVSISTNWYQFGVLLKLNATELDAIEEMNEGTEFKIKKMFELWLSTNPNATRREIIEALKSDDIGRSAVAEKYELSLKESEWFII